MSQGPSDSDALERQRLLLQGLVQVMADGVMVTNERLDVLEYSGASERIYGWTREEALGRNLARDFGSEFPDGDGDEVLRRLAAGEPVRAHMRALRKDATWADLDLSATPLRDPEGRLTGWLSVARDIGPQVAAERARREAAEQVRSVVAATAEGVVLLDASGRVLSANAAAEAILGLTTGEMAGRASGDPRWRTIHVDGRPFPGEEHPAMVTLRSGEPLRGVVMGLHTPEGVLRWLSVGSEPLRHEPGEPPYAVVVTFADITAQRRLLDELAEQERRLAFVLEGSNDGFWDWDVPSGRVWFSERWATMLGFSREELEPHVRTWERLVHPRDLARVMEAVGAVLDGRTDHYECEHRVRHKDGTWCWILDRGKVVARDAAGRPLRAAGSHTDITARKEAEEALHAAHADNDRLVKDLRAALHDVKTLSGLVPICMDCKRVRDEQGAWERLEDYLGQRTAAELSHGLCPDCARHREDADP
jgi:PAS domain S-box-containing protein